MKRSRFDPSRAAGAPRGESSDASGAAGSLFAGDGAVPPPAALTGAAPAHAASSAISVSELASRIEGALAKGFPDRVRVVGEISNLRKQTHLYFNLKDPDGGDDSKHGAVISCVMFAKDASGVRFTPADGAKVVITGRIAFFAKQGRTQLYVEAMEPMGLGALEQRFRALSEELKKLGYFEPERKRALPVFPRRVAVVTSRTGAALQDVLSTMKRRCAAVDVAVVDVRVQGDGAAPSIVRALDWLSREHERLGVDAVIVTRGGGSIEDLWAFNERAVAEAIVRSSVPVVAAIGHETDVTIAELVADARCATPTQAAMVLTPDRAALGEELLHRRARLVHSMLRRFERERMRLSVVEAQPLYADPAAMVREARGVVESWGAAVSAAWQEAVSARRLVLERLS
ncbi:MAG TPA: exodeoxyribonuclease VII large subunit, partial [Phycisphaerales bacterium]|nr:exodeoxyribonuclease VII large subunit [Phycisphaerales bacterium]